MHEFSLVRSLLEQVGRIVTSQGGRAAVEVRVEIGPLSGVEPLLVKAAFAQLAGDGTLIIDEVPLTARRGADRRFTICPPGASSLRC